MSNFTGERTPLKRFIEVEPDCSQGYLSDKLLRRNTESRSSDVDSLALIEPGEGDHGPRARHPLHLPQSEYDEPVVLGESHHAPPVGQGEGQAEEDVGEAGHQPHDDQGHHRGLVRGVGHMLNTRAGQMSSTSPA